MNRVSGLVLAVLVFCIGCSSGDADFKTVATLLNDWTSYDQGINFAAPRYRKDGSGRVTLSGMVKNGKLNAPILQLPPGYRPMRQLLFVANTAGGTGDLRVSKDGTVSLAGGNTGWVSLEVSFFAEE